MNYVDPRNLRVRMDALGSAEQLVGFGFRCWLAGYQNNDISCWSAGWDRFSNELGVTQAKPIVNELAFWVQKVSECSNRKINCAPIDCKAFCQDECTAISLVAASQHKTCPALQACACALLGTDENIECVLDTTESFSYTLKMANVRLKDSINVN